MTERSPVLLAPYPDSPRPCLPKNRTIPQLVESRTTGLLIKKKINLLAIVWQNKYIYIYIEQSSGINTDRMKKQNRTKQTKRYRTKQIKQNKSNLPEDIPD
jgi:hypothetical protein